MKKFAPVSALVLFAFSLSAQVPTWSWGRNAGGTTNDRAWAVSSDGEGRTYVTGHFRGTAQFGSQSVTASQGNAFLARYDSTGNCLWVQQAGANSIPAAEGFGVAQDAAGNAYITGRTWGTSFFGSNFIPGNNLAAVFIAKYDTAGNNLWVRTTSMPQSNADTRGIAVDSLGYAYITGNLYGGTHSFGNFTLTGSCGFVAKYDPNGNVVYAVQLGSNGGAELHAIAIDKTGNAYLTGYLAVTDSIGSQSYSPTCVQDFLVIKLDSAGSVSWVRQSVVQLTTNFYIWGKGIAFDDQEGAVYALGEGTGGDFYIGNDTVHSPSSMGLTIFLVKYDAAGNQQWLLESTEPTGYAPIYAEGVACDKSSDVYITGHTSYNFNFAGQYVPGNIGGVSVYVIKIKPYGAGVYAVQSGGQGSAVRCSGIAIGDRYAVYVAGRADFPFPVFGPDTLSPVGPLDMFVARLGQYNSGVGIGETQQEQGIALYNQPGGFVLSLADEKLLEGKTIFTLYDMTGRIVKEVPVISTSTTIGSAELAAGIYAWQLTCRGNFVAAGKAIRQ